MDRYKTNLAILKESGVKSEDILVCTGNGFADSLSASAVGKPIMLVAANANDEQKAYLDTLNTDQFYLIGGTGVVSENIAKEIGKYGKVKRVAGENRYATSVAVAKEFFSNSKAVVLAYGLNFPDGLSGAPLALSLEAPLTLTTNDAQAFEITASYVNGETDAERAVSLGGEGLISSEVAIKHIRRHDFCVPVYYDHTSWVCYWCYKEDHTSERFGDADYICGNWGNAEHFVIVAYRCKYCDEMIDVKDYKHQCEWKPVYGKAAVLQCNYCEEEGFTTLVENDTRWPEGAGADPTQRQIHRNNKCWEKCRLDHPEAGDYINKYMMTEGSRSYISYYVCTKCSRIKDNDVALSLQVEGKKQQIKLVRPDSEWSGLTGTEWILPTLGDIEEGRVEVYSNSMSPYAPLSGNSLCEIYPVPPRSQSNILKTYTCQFCNLTIGIFDVNDHYCEYR